MLAFGLLLQIIVVGAAVVVQAAVVDFQYVLTHVVEEIPVVRHHEDGQTLPRQEILQPFYHLNVQMVGGLVQQQQVCMVDQYPAQRRFLLLASAQGLHGLVQLPVEAQTAQYLLYLLFESPLVLVFRPFHRVDEAAKCLVGCHLGLLGQVGHLHLAAEGHLALVLKGFARQNVQQG